MSVQERPTSPLPLKTEVKPRPEIPPKPQASSPPPGDRRSSGKVKRIVNKFSKQESVEAKEQPANVATELLPNKKFKRPPTIKPKPGRNGIQRQVAAEQAPPLPMKRSRILQKQKDNVGGEDGDGISVEGGRSAPDGKEVEVPVIGGGDVEAELSPDTPLSPCCDPGCSCMCHIQRPGMKLIWVPVEVIGGEEGDVDGEEWEEEEEEEEEEHEEEQEDDKEKLERGGEEASETGDEVDRTSVVEENEGLKQEKTKFHQSLGVLIAEGHRRRSDPGPHAILTSLAVSRSHSPPIPPKRAHSPPVLQKPPQSEEENIYEATLPVVDLTPVKTTSGIKELDIPLIKVRKPARRNKLSPSTSDPTSNLQPPTEPISSTYESPPAIPPRMPVSQDSRSLTPVHRGGIPLPQPTPEEWRSLRPSSPSSSTASRLSPQRAITPPPTSPLQPHRPPPPPPKTDPRRLSSASLQSLTQKKGEEDGENDGEKDDAGEEMCSIYNDSLRREISFIFESRLQDEPLYQTYRATVITKEIRRQTVCRNISKTSADYSMDWTAHRPRASTGTGTGNGIGTPRGNPVPTPGQSTLWQDLPSVRDSGVLENLTPEHCKYQESMFEVLTSEASYLRSLRVLTEHFLDSRDLEETMIIRERKTLFSNILRVREVSERFLKDLEDRIFKDLVFPDICDIIHYHAQHNFPAYIDYVRNQIYQEKTYTELMKNNANFAAVISRLQESPQCQRLPFMSFLLLPFQRITRIKMLIENILKRTKEGTKEEQAASKALASLSKIIDECNTQVGKMRQMEELIYVSQTLEFDKLKAIPIISQNRYLEKKGELQEMSKGATLFNMRTKFNPVYLFLFNDLLIIATKKGAERYVVLDHAHRSLVQVQPLDVGGSSGGPCENCFNLTLLENHQGRMMERLLKAPSQSDMHRWLAAFPNPTNTDRDDDEVIYEDWDCPQVQCVEQYIAQQADELTLEPTEIINVIRKTNEGWYEGNRLSDGQKGWFPVANVIEITNEHVRRRNLRERYRVIQAACMVANSKNRIIQ
ncbi:rho guanine nucleotide exchange factor 15 isoform X2 [Parambassis ranga]|uniref:Rho guanine nucleotide exchange factor 15 isoform X2 n=1 Tax=Parambassis ranga TaxID=210632 RepID=A0A6P7KBY9_9TELE|nr:rho guanine nucleotide exchange factor 15-like isoform X2 [Parambassis ranga]